MQLTRDLINSNSSLTFFAILLQTSGTSPLCQFGRRSCYLRTLYRSTNYKSFLSAEKRNIFYYNYFYFFFNYRNYFQQLVIG